MSLLKLKNPNSIFFLRGNHENLEMNKYYGFDDELKGKFIGNFGNNEDRING